MPLVLPPDLKPHSFLTVEEAAAVLNVKVRWMREAVADRRIGHYKVAHLVRIQVADLFAFVAAGRVEPGSRRSDARESGSAQAGGGAPAGTRHGSGPAPIGPGAPRPMGRTAGSAARPVA